MREPLGAEVSAAGQDACGPRPREGQADLRSGQPTPGTARYVNSPSVARPGTRQPLEQPCAAAIQCRLDHGEHDTLEGRSEQHGP